MKAVAPIESDWYQNFLGQVRRLIVDIKGNLIALGKAVVAGLDHNPRIRDTISKDVPELSSGFIDVLERIGRGHMLPEIFLNPECDKLALAPVSIQREILERGVMVVERAGKEFRPTYKKVNEITHADAKLALKGGNVRSFQEQVEILTPGPKIHRPDWMLDEEGNLVVNRAPTVISPDQIVGFYEKIMSRKKSALESTVKKNQIRKSA